MATQGHSSHGNTVAAWTTVGTLIVASFVMCLAVGIGLVWLFVVGVVIAAGGLVAGKLLSMSGHGAPRQDDQKLARDAR